MNKKLFTMLSVLLIAMVAVSPVSAGGVKISFSPGSLRADGNGFGFSSYDEVQVALAAKAWVHVSCKDPVSGVVVPGRNPIVGVFAVAKDSVKSDKNGRFPIGLHAEPAISTAQAGCPDATWIVQIGFEDWYWASVKVTQVSTGNTLWYREYTCTSTPTPTVDCQAIR